MIDAAKSLLDDFRALPGRVERPRTLLEIAGYPHYENVCSNILAFFMDAEESHELGTLVLDALASAGNIAEADEGIGGNVSVEREAITEAGNRIDLLIMSDDRAILIENKIYAAANNPFGDYSTHLDKIGGDRTQHKLLLTLSKTSEGSEWGFANLTYKGFVGGIRSLLGRQVSSADTRYLIIFLDFLNTLENLQRGSRMNQEFVKLLAKRDDDAEHLLGELVQFKDELRKKVRELGGLIELEKHQNVRQYFYREKTGLFDDLVHDIRVSEDLLVAIDTIPNARGWRSFIWPRQGDRQRLATLLKSLEISYEEGGLLIPATQTKRFVHPTRFAYDEDLNRIRLVLQDLIDKIATSKEHEE